MDVLIYPYMMADNLQLDLGEVIKEKLIKNGLKYPVEKSAGVRKKYTEFQKCVTRLLERAKKKQ